MAEKSPLSRQALVDTIAAAAQALGLDRLPQEVFLKHSGFSRFEVEKHFDKWSDACRAAGIAQGRSLAEQPRKPHSTDEECIAELKRVARLKGVKALSSKQYSEYSRISPGTLRLRFGSWPDALAAAGLSPTAAAQRQRTPTQEECVQEMRRIAQVLGRSHLTAEEFDAQAKVSAFRIVRVFKSWSAALQAAGLESSPNVIREVPISTLADDFLRVSIALGRVPTITQLTRRSRHVSHTFSGKHGGYRAFKHAAIDHLLSNNARIPSAIKTLFETEIRQFPTEVVQTPDNPQAQPHRQGRTLNFRAFAYAPTCEHDVVQMFGAVAQELGFEILANRSAFPDCQARRRRPGTRETFLACLIEYEFASLDYRRHGHPVSGCDLVVCWRHDWAECPIEVLELYTEIRTLKGWQ